MKKCILGITTIIFVNTSFSGTMGIDIDANPWNGFYLGINGGGGIAADAVSQRATYGTTAFPVSTLLSTRSRYSLSGGEFGGQVGYNVQHGSWLIGAEGDIDWASLSSSSNDYCTPSASSFQFSSNGGNVFGYCLRNKPKINNLGTIRGRVGYIVSNVLLYATGGGAWSSVKSTFTSPVEATAPGVFSDARQQGLFLANFGSFSSTHSAWTVGGGIETPLWGHLSAKAEYLYVNYGRIHNVLPLTVNPAYGTDYTAGSVASVDTLSSMSSNIIRVGINYKV